MSSLSEKLAYLSRAADKMNDDAHRCGDRPRDFIPSVARLFMAHVDCEYPDDYDESSDLGLYLALNAARAYLGESA